MGDRLPGRDRRQRLASRTVVHPQVQGARATVRRADGGDGRQRQDDDVVERVPVGVAEPEIRQFEDIGLVVVDADARRVGGRRRVLAPDGDLEAVGDAAVVGGSGGAVAAGIGYRDLEGLRPGGTAPEGVDFGVVAVEGVDPVAVGLQDQRAVPAGEGVLLGSADRRLADAGLAGVAGEGEIPPDTGGLEAAREGGGGGSVVGHGRRGRRGHLEVVPVHRDQDGDLGARPGAVRRHHIDGDPVPDAVGDACPRCVEAVGPAAGGVDGETAVAGVRGDGEGGSARHRAVDQQLAGGVEVALPGVLDIEQHVGVDPGVPSAAEPRDGERRLPGGEAVHRVGLRAGAVVGRRREVRDMLLAEGVGRRVPEGDELRRRQAVGADVDGDAVAADRNGRGRPGRAAEGDRPGVPRRAGGVEDDLDGAESRPRRHRLGAGVGDNRYSRVALGHHPSTLCLFRVRPCPRSPVFMRCGCFRFRPPRLRWPGTATSGHSPARDPGIRVREAAPIPLDARRVAVWTSSFAWQKVLVLVRLDAQYTLSSRG